MSRAALTLPKVGLVMENVKIVRWLKTSGELIQQGEPLLEIETEKSIIEIEAPSTGRLLEIVRLEGSEAQVGDTIAWLESEPSLVADGATAAILSAQSKNPAAAADSRPLSIEPAIQQNIQPAATRPIIRSPGSRIRSSPVARRLAREHGLDLSTVTGGGPRGLIQLTDVRAALSRRPAADSKASLSTANGGLSPMRRALARAMSLSNATVPQFSLERDIDWTRVQSIRTRLLAALPAGASRPSVNDFLMQAIARTLMAFPDLNATFSGEVDAPDATLTARDGAHVGLVIAANQGVLVAVLAHAHRYSLDELATRREDLVQRALAGKLRRDELEGATFSLSNLGAKGPDRFTAMINPPHSAILAVGRQREAPVVINGGLHIRPISTLTLTVDHRVADGRLAADYLAALVEFLEGDRWHTI